MLPFEPRVVKLVTGVPLAERLESVKNPKLETAPVAALPSGVGEVVSGPEMVLFPTLIRAEPLLAGVELA